MDFILELLVKEYEDNCKKLNFYADENSITTNQIVYNQVKAEFGLKDWEINMLIYSLFLDKYVKSIEPIVISIEGLVFRNNGGYAEKSIMINQKSNRIQKVENYVRKYTFYLMVFTAILAIANPVEA